MEHQLRASKPASVRSTRPPPGAAAAAAASGAGSISRGRIELGLEPEESELADGAGGSLVGSSAALSRRPGALLDSQTVDPRRAQAKEQSVALQNIVRGRASGCSGSHQLPGKMDF